MSIKKKLLIQPKPHFNSIQPLNNEQAEYIKLIENNDIIVAVGKAGCGKTAIAASLAAEHLFYHKVEKIVLTRPIIGAEDLGYLPGDPTKKIHPYLQPMFVELSYFMDVEKAMSEKKLLVSPLAYMRGVTLKGSFIISDEMSNADNRLIKMLLTRFGYGSKMVMTGDITQSDLTGRKANSFREIIEKVIKPLATSENRIAFIELQESVRHPLVELISSKFDEIYGYN